jgi:hypothetical protein
MSQIKNVIGVFLGQLFGMLIFLVILGLLNFLVPYVDTLVFSNIVCFLNSNLLIILLFGLFFMVAGMFFSLVFPFNLPAPLFSSFGSIFLVTFIFNVLSFISLNLGLEMGVFLDNFYFIILTIVFVIVFISGYGIVFSSAFRKVKVREKRVKRVRRKRRGLKKNSKKIKDSSIEDIKKAVE